jgi:predicted DNA-binding transcriptional regulator AlpA
MQPKETNMAVPNTQNYRPDTILRPAQVAKKLGVGKTSFYALVKGMGFPRAIILGKHARGYSENEVDAWIKAQARA